MEIYFFEGKENNFVLRRGRMGKRQNKTKPDRKKESCKGFIKKKTLEIKFNVWSSWLRLKLIE